MMAGEDLAHFRDILFFQDYVLRHAEMSRLDGALLAKHSKAFAQFERFVIDQLAPTPGRKA